MWAISGGRLHQLPCDTAYLRLRLSPRCLPSTHAAKRSSSKLRTQAIGAQQDPGHWSYSPEWWGTQGNGWGRDAGVPVFEQHSHDGNGKVTVTAHAASIPRSMRNGQVQQEHQWRVLRFNETRQSVSRVSVEHDILFTTAECLAFEYLKTMGSAAAAVIGMTDTLRPCLGNTQVSQQPDSMRHADDRPNQKSSGGHAVLQQQSSSQGMPQALCLGLGGGSLPLFLSHHFPGLMVQAVELDPIVISAATQEMGLPSDRGNLSLHQAEAGHFMAELAADVAAGARLPLDLLFIDLFNGKDDIPSILCSPDSPMLQAMATALHLGHGTVIMNMHGGGMPAQNALVALFARLLPGEDSKGYHPSTEQGRAVQQVGSAIRNSVLTGQPSKRGAAFTLKVASQANIILVISRAIECDEQKVKGELALAARYVAEQTCYKFDAAMRCNSGLASI